MKTPFWPVPLGSKPIDLGLERVVEALKKMGNPHLKLPPVIHIAGTNGKGSTLAFLRAILEAEGYNCHVYTSPHLVEFNERIVVAGKEISDEFLNEVLNETKNLTDSVNLTFFEGTTLAAILAFSKVKADFVLLETGMGGRLDATNIIDDPLLTIITPISLDHTEFLGDTLAKIAFEKASIMKKGAPCVSAPQVAKVAEVLKNYADKIGCQLLLVSHQKDSDNQSPHLKPSLPGKHQYMNAAVAVKSVLELKNKGYKISDTAIEKGVSSAKWLARLQDVSDIFGIETYLDGSHNPQGAKTISEFLKDKNSEEEKGNEVANYLIIGMLKNKDVEGFLKNLNPKKSNVKKIFFIEIPDEPNSANPEELKKIADSLNFISEIAKNLDDALNKIIAIKEREIQNPEQKNKRVIICGSLYLAGWVLEKYHT